MKKEKEGSGNLAGLRKFTTCNFRRLQNFTTLLPCTPELTAFLPAFCGFVDIFP